MNYNKCDFTPIMGAEVEIKTDPYTYKGRFVCKKDTISPFPLCEKVSIFERRGDHCFEYGVPVDEIASLKATMKPKDMNLEQLYRLAEEKTKEKVENDCKTISEVLKVCYRPQIHWYEVFYEIKDDPSVLGKVSIDPDKPVDITHWLKEEQE